MKKNIIKITYTLIMIAILVANCTTIYAAASSIGMGDVHSMIGQKDTKLNGRLENFMGNAMGFAQVVAASVAIVMLIILATKYIMASSGEKAEIKQHAVVYVFGAVLLFAGVGIVEFIKKFMEGM